MYFASIIILLVVTVLAYLSTKKIYNPISLIGCIWTLIFLSFNEHQKDYVRISIKTDLLLFTGLACWLFGCAVGMTCKSAVQNRIESRADFYTVLEDNNQILAIATWISIVIFLRRDIAFIQYLLAGHSWEQARYSFIFLYIANEASTLSNILTVYIANPILIISLLTLSYRIVKNQKIKKMDALFLLDIFAQIFSDGNRLTIATLGVCIVINYLLSDNVALSIKQKRIIRTLVICLTIAFAYFTIRRGNFLFQISSYLGGAIPFFQVLNSQNEKLTYGLFSFQGFLKPIGKILELIFKVDIFSDVTELYSRIQDGMSIGNSRINSVCTIFYSFYSDYDILGIVIFPILIGLIIGQAYRAANYRNNFWTHTIYLYGALMIIYSFLPFLFIQVNYSMALVYMYVFASLSKKFRLSIVKAS